MTESAPHTETPRSFREMTTEQARVTSSLREYGYKGQGKTDFDAWNAAEEQKAEREGTQLNHIIAVADVQFIAGLYVEAVESYAAAAVQAWNCYNDELYQQLSIKAAEAARFRDQSSKK